jgi:predicted transcriptional regulator
MVARRRKQEKERPDLSKMEMEVMDVLWRLGECTSADVIAAYRETRDLAETTVRTVLSNLRRKGYVELVPTTERIYRYRASISRDSVARKSLGSLVTRILEGSPRQAIHYLLEAEEMDDAELEAIRKMIDRKRKERNHEK